MSRLAKNAVVVDRHFAQLKFATETQATNKCGGVSVVRIAYSMRAFS